MTASTLVVVETSVEACLGNDRSRNDRVTTTSEEGRSAEIAATRAFFGPRARDWEVRFPDDEPRYAQAVAELAPMRGGIALDVACGTGRALPWLRTAVGPAGTVVGLDVTAQMLAEASRRGRASVASLILADAVRLPLAAQCVDSIFAAGLLPHLADPVAGLHELARICRPGARLALFHPIGRLALARRRGHVPDPDDIRAESAIRPTLAEAGWQCERVDDGDDRYLVLAALKS
jgi:SAM-dependent methyltransferase